MSKQPPRDENEAAARAVAQTTESGDLPADAEAAWSEWIGSIQKIDDRAWTLLRAAFEVGYEAGKRD